MSALLAGLPDQVNMFPHIRSLHISRVPLRSGSKIADTSGILCRAAGCRYERLAVSRQVKSRRFLNEQVQMSPGHHVKRVPVGTSTISLCSTGVAAYSTEGDRVRKWM